MSYDEAIQYLYNLRVFGMKFGLENVFRMAALAGNPQDRLRFIHVAGTNGKGSTCAMLESIYRAAGFRVGLFTSPHLVSFAERIQVNRELIAKTEVARLVVAMREMFDSGGFSGAPPTFFEVVTVMALQYFAAQRCDLVIWETGLGGRLDATNIVTPLACVITNVQLDHQKWLGETIAEIAREKAGIIKPNIPIVTAAAEPSALEVIRQTANAANAPLTVITDAASYLGDFEIALAGSHQKTNAALAVAVARLLKDAVRVSETAIRAGLQQTRWAGRLQTVQRPGGQTILLDGAHNPDGARTLAAALRESFPGRHPTLILGTMRDKDVAALCQILAPLADQIVVAPVDSERTADPRSLLEICGRCNPKAKIQVCDSLAAAVEKTIDEQFIVVTGSIHFIGQALELLEPGPVPSERTLNEYQPPPVLAVTFDIGGTLIEPQPSVGHVYAKVAARNGIPIPPDILNSRFAIAWKAKKNFAHTLSDWSALVDETFAGLVTAPPSQTFFHEIYEAFASPEAWRIYDDVLPCLEELRRRGLKLGAISNWDERLRPLLKKLELDKWFDSIVVSTEFGVSKPSASIFRRAAAQLQTASSSIIHVGDSREEDFEGAKSAGFQSLLLKRGTPSRPGESICKLTDLLYLPIGR